MFRSLTFLSALGVGLCANSGVIAQSVEQEAPAYLWQQTTLEAPNMPGGKTALFAYIETATSRPIITGLCRSDGETTVAEMSLAAQVGNAANEAPIKVEFAVFGDNEFEGQVQRPADLPPYVSLRLPLDSSLFTSLRQQSSSAYRIAGNIQNLELKGSSAALSAFTAACQGVSQAFAQLKATYATCQTLRPRTRSIIRKKTTVVNNSGSVRLMRRLSSSGALGGPTRLEPGQSIRFDSRVHTIFQFEDEAGNCIQRARVRSSGSLVITAPNKIEI